MTEAKSSRRIFLKAGAALAAAPQVAPVAGAMASAAASVAPVPLSLQPLLTLGEDGLKGLFDLMGDLSYVPTRITPQLLADYSLEESEIPQTWQGKGNDIRHFCITIAHLEKLALEHPNVPIHQLLPMLRQPDAADKITKIYAERVVQPEIANTGDHISNAAYIRQKIEYFTSQMNHTLNWLRQYPEVFECNSAQAFFDTMLRLAAQQIQYLPDVNIPQGSVRPLNAYFDLRPDDARLAARAEALYEQVLTSLPPHAQTILRNIGVQTPPQAPAQPEPETAQTLKLPTLPPLSLMRRLSLLGYETLHPIKLSVDDRANALPTEPTTENCTDPHPLGRIHSPIAMQLAPKP